MDRARLLALYLHLARASGLRRRPLVRDKLLVLGLATAGEMGLEEIAEYCRREVLRHNPRHILRRWPLAAAALEDEEFQGFVTQLRRQYGPEKAEHLAHSLDLQTAGERATYFSDHEYAAALLGHTPASLSAALADSPQPSADSPDDETHPTVAARIGPTMIFCGAVIIIAATFAAIVAFARW